MIAALVFRRNWSAELSLLRLLDVLQVGPTEPPAGAAAWFELLQHHPLIGMTHLNIFDLVNYALVGLMLLALHASLRRVAPTLAPLALGCGGAGVSVALASNQAFAMLSLSARYAAAGTEVERTELLAAGQALLAIDSPGVPPGAGAAIALLLVTVGSVLMAAALVRSRVFRPAIGYLGMVAEVVQLGYFVTLAVAPSLAALPPSLAAPFRLVWYVLTGRRLLQLAAAESDPPRRPDPWG